nr:uncharacterized protein LOC110089341 [Pogona vitticeps]
MVPRKGVGTKKGKQPAKRRQVTQVSPPQSSSDEESWPVWQKLQNKIATLEAQTLGKQPSQPGKGQQRRSARESKSHRRARLRVVARKLTQRCASLESAQSMDASARRDQDGATVAAKRRRTKEQQPLPLEDLELAYVSQDEQDEMEEADGSALQHPKDLGRASTSYGLVGMLECDCSRTESAGQSWREQHPPPPNPSRAVLLKKWRIQEILYILVTQHACMHACMYVWPMNRLLSGTMVVKKKL